MAAATVNYLENDVVVTLSKMLDIWVVMYCHVCANDDWSLCVQHQDIMFSTVVSAIMSHHTASCVHLQLLIECVRSDKPI